MPPALQLPPTPASPVLPPEGWRGKLQRAGASVRVTTASGPSQAGNALDPRRNPHRHAAVGPQEAGGEPNRFSHQLDGREALDDLFPDDAQLHLGHPHPDAAVDPEAEG